ncbi:PE-family protein [Mycobacterium leprae Kyoto-2]|uniref:PE family protein n=3 Tax=Mycobacterium leprae TaxID=1769 RepID=A0AAD0P6A0_MYCLR|nr:PE family protein [Mycobacterium leprae]OAX70787.1 PbsX family transcriptional regulator [Mycobacterium leprae 7935681]CAR70503.1 putative PE-family protein [Mycobacterium leprae Br4923]BBC16553.1 PE-family protein [Mycobacterium leprae Kyoto-2]AWV47332.1 PE family protein [Mycobacterium leprae]OAR20601.1 PbsX family transcriptional regulator [Mycobacterium leprae 3125609]
MSFFLRVEVGGLMMAAGRLERITSESMACNAKLTPVTTKVVPPAADQVSKLASQVFSSYGKQYEGYAAQGVDQSRLFVQSLKDAAGDYMDSDHMYLNTED